MKINTQDLTGPAIDWAVAKCEGREPRAIRSTLNGQISIYTMRGVGLGHEPFAPSSNWAHGGPIIELNRIELIVNMDGDWVTSHSYAGRPAVRVTGPTALIAAMRCYVARKLGDEVDIPEELC